MLELLQSEDVRELTGKREPERQAEELERIGIPHQIRRVGRRTWVAVSRHHVREWLEGRPVAVSRRPTLERVT